MIQVFNSNGVTIINGKVIEGKDLGKRVKIEEKRKQDAEYIDSILINSGAIDIDMVKSNTLMIEAHLCGQLNIDNDETKTKFEFEVKGRQLVISVDVNGKCYFNNLKLTVAIPSKMLNKICIYAVSAGIKLCGDISIKLLKVETASGDIDILEDVTLNDFEVITTSGNIKSKCDFTKTKLEVTSGDVNLNIDAKNDITLDISTTSGDVNLKLNNIKSLKLSSQTRCGDVKNRYIGFGKYIANGVITTVTGDIKIK